MLETLILNVIACFPETTDQNLLAKVQMRLMRINFCRYLIINQSVNKFSL